MGKTSVCALLRTELARQNFRGSIPAIDGDPAQTLHLALGLPAPPATIADVRDSVRLDAQTIQAMGKRGVSPAEYVWTQLTGAQAALVRYALRGKTVDYMAMGQGEGPGCYCKINTMLKTILSGLAGRYDLVLVDSEAGMEHISRYRLGRVDLFLTVLTPAPASRTVARRIMETTRNVGIEIGEQWVIYNQSPHGYPPAQTGAKRTITVPRAWEVLRLEGAGRPIVNLGDGLAVRRALQPVVGWIVGCGSAQAEKRVGVCA